MSKESLGWLIVRVLGLVVLVEAARLLFIGLAGCFALATVNAEFPRMVIIEVAEGVVALLFSYYLLRRGAMIHNLLMYEDV